MSIKHPTLLTDILKEIGIPDTEIGIVIKNGRWSPIECEVEENDSIELFPPLYGG